MSEQEKVMFSLKEKANMLGITYHPNIGEEKLRAKIAEKLADQPSVDPMTTGEIKTGKKELTEGQKLVKRKKEASKLERVIITSFDPNKKEWEGEIFSVGNSKLGMFKKYIPYGIEWHVPAIILKTIDDKQVQSFYKTKVNGKTVTRSRLIKAYGIERLDPLTTQELQDLAKAQAASGRLEGE